MGQEEDESSPDEQWNVLFDLLEELPQNTRQMVGNLKTAHKFKSGLARLLKLGRKEGISGKKEG